MTDSKLEELKKLVTLHEEWKESDDDIILSFVSDIVVKYKDCKFRADRRILSKYSIVFKEALENKECKALEIMDHILPELCIIVILTYIHMPPCLMKQDKLF